MSEGRVILRSYGKRKTQARRDRKHLSERQRNAGLCTPFPKIILLGKILADQYLAVMTPCQLLGQNLQLDLCNFTQKRPWKAIPLQNEWQGTGSSMSNGHT